jgi:hypothetical protein
MQFILLDQVRRVLRGLRVPVALLGLLDLVRMAKMLMNLSRRYQGLLVVVDRLDLLGHKVMMA